MKWRHLIVLFPCTALILIAGCRSDKAAQLVGSWKLDTGFANGTTTFSKDGTYIQTVTGITNGSEKGTWRIEGDKLIMKAETSSLDTGSVGKEQAAKIVKLEDPVLILEMQNKSGKTDTITLQRLK